MSKSKKITVAISSGDINGIGLEVALKAFEDVRMLEHCTPIIYASKQACLYHAKQNQISAENLHFTDSFGNVADGKINVLEIWNGKVWIEFGQPKKEAGVHAYESLKRAVEDIASNKADVLITAPIHKASIQSSEFQFPGHTEYLANYANVDTPLMLLNHGQLRVALASGHMPLKEVSSYLNVSLIQEKIAVLSKSLSMDFGISRPKIAVLGLNPHNSDNGLLGHEEAEIIEPAVINAQQDGYLAFGPYPADGFFGSSGLKTFDGVLAMYHDQGLGPFKALAFGHGVNYTAGLPIVRTSPDHGTAFDIAGKGMADPGSFRQAVHLACDIYRERKAQRELTKNAMSTSSK